jgi:hypothetical protein
LPVPETLVKTVPEHGSPPIFGNKKKFPFSSQISGTIKNDKLLFKKRNSRREKERKKLGRMDRWTDGWTDGRTNEREIDKQIYREKENDRERERER